MLAEARPHVFVTLLSLRLRAALSRERLLLRIGKRVEDELDESAIAKEFDAFEDSLVEAFPQLNDVMDGEMTPAELRRNSLIGSNVMLRGLALAWHGLRQEGWGPDKITSAFATQLAPHIETPVLADPEDTWYATGLFPATENGSYSPTSRAQDFKTLATFIADACKGNVTWNRVTA